MKSSSPKGVEARVLELVRSHPFASQKELAAMCGLTRSAVAAHIAALTKRGEILGRAYVLPTRVSAICVGATHIDIKARTIGPLRRGTSNPVQTYRTPGGVARNVAVILAALGVPSTIISVIGDDAAGLEVRAQTATAGVDASGLHVIPGARTATYTAVTGSNGQLAFGLADMTIYEAMTWQVIEREAARLAAASAVFIDTNLPAETLKKLVRSLAHSAAIVAVDAVSVAKSARLPEKLDGISHVFCNLDEASAITGESRADRAAKAILARGAGAAIVTLGAQGAIVATPGRTHRLRTQSSGIVEATGAGDALIGATLSALLNGYDLADAVCLGQDAARATLATTDSVGANLTGVRASLAKNTAENRHD